MSANCPLDRRVPLKDHPTEKQAKEKNIFKRGWKAMRKSTQAKTKVHPLVAEQESQVHPDTSSVEPPAGTDALQSEPTDENQAKEKNIFERGWKAMRKSTQAKTKVHPLVAEQESQVHPDTSSVEPPAGTDALQSEPTDEKSPEHGKRPVVEPFVPPADPVPEPSSSSAPSHPGFTPNKEFFECLYNVKKLIGSGGFGRVFLGRRKFDRKKVAIKRISKVDNKHYLKIPGHPEPLVTEVALLLLMMCREPMSPFVIQLYEWFEHPSEFTLIMEYPGHCETLSDTMDRRDWCDSFSRNIMTQAVCAVKACIDHGVFYSDIHMKNFLYNEDNGELKLIDFGCGQLLSSEGYASNTFMGVLEYYPPEVLTEPRFHAVPANVWSLGVLLYELSNKWFPFLSREDMEQAKVTFKNPDLSENCKDLIRRCLARDPTERPSLEQMLEHEWFDGPSKMEQTPYTNPVDHETMMCLPGQVCEDLCVPGPSKIKKTQHADPVDPEMPPVPEPSSCDLGDKKSPEHGKRPVVEPFVPPADPVPEPSSSSAPSHPGFTPNKEFFECLYNVKKLIGSGGFGRVFLGRRKFDRKKVAIKRISKVDNKHYLKIPGHPEPLVTEVALLLLMMCREPMSPFVIQLYEWFEHPSEFTLIMEYPGYCETLSDTMDRRDWCDSFSRNIMTQAVCAVKACIDHGVFYSDIHMKNFLYNEDNGELKLIDFGCGQLFSSEGYASNTFMGVPAYCPPEVLTESRFHAVPANVWSLGVLLYELSNKWIPFLSREDTEQAKVTFKNPDLSENCKDLIRRCLARDPTERPSLEQMLEHEWFDRLPDLSPSTESLDTSY